MDRRAGRRGGGGGLPAGRWPAAFVVLLDAAFMGLQLDLPLDRGHPDQRRAVLDLAAALATLTRADAGDPPS